VSKHPQYQAENHLHPSLLKIPKTTETNSTNLKTNFNKLYKNPESESNNI
jgi:hypothetical protein